MKASTPETIDEYLAPLPSDKRAALEKLRAAIKSAAPRAEECISYQVPCFRLDGKLLVHFGAAAKHCSFFPGPRVIEQLADELAGYEVSKGTIRFSPERPLPDSLVRKIVKTVIAAQPKAKAAGASRGKRGR